MDREWKTLAVAARIMERGQRDRWALADAVLADLPETDYEVGRPGNGSSSTPILVNDLGALALALADQGITRAADGETYSPVYLRDQRQVAMAWQPIDRQAEAAFDVHRECRDGDARIVMLALCRHARGEKVSRPAASEATAWRDALAKMATVRKGLPVSAQAVRMALGKASKNAPVRLDGATFAELCSHLLVGTDGLSAFENRFADYDMDEADRDRFAGILRKLIARAEAVLAVLTASVTDEDLAELIAQERES